MQIRIARNLVELSVLLCSRDAAITVREQVESSVKRKPLMQFILKCVAAQFP